jgi:hypothetical protein
MNDTRKPVAHEITEGVILALRPLRRRGRRVKVMDEVWEKILRPDPRFAAGIPPEMSNPDFYKAVRSACGQLGMKAPPDRAIKAWRRKRS